MLSAVRTKLKAFAQDERGAVAIEYGLVASLVGIGSLIAVQELGQTLAGMFGDIARILEAVVARMH